MSDSVTPWTAAHQASQSFTISRSLLKFISTESVTLSNCFILYRLLLICLQSFPASGSFLMSQVFASDDQSTGASASASVLPINISGLISFRIDWFDLLAVQGTLKSFPNTTVQKHQSSALSFLYSPTLTSVHDYWKSQTLTSRHLSASNVSAF